MTDSYYIITLSHPHRKRKTTIRRATLGEAIKLGSKYGTLSIMPKSIAELQRLHFAKKFRTQSPYFGLAMLWKCTREQAKHALGLDDLRRAVYLVTIRNGGGK